MTTQEIWNTIVREVNKSRYLKECEVQSLWEELFSDPSLFGYSKYAKEMDPQRHIQLGAKGHVRPDIILRDSISNKDLFLVELKQLNATYDTSYKQQMFSYMRLTNLKIGVLIYNKLSICYLADDNTESFVEIPFEENNNNGIKFVELFRKGNFDQSKVIEFVENHKRLKLNINEIRKDLQNLSLTNLLKKYYQDKYSDQEIEQAVSGLQISVVQKEDTSQQIIHTNNPQSKFNSWKTHAHKSYSTYSNRHIDYYDEPSDFDYIIIKTTNERIEYCKGSLYEATRYAWKVKYETVSRYPYVFSVVGGIVKAVYAVDHWQIVTSGESPGRYEFFGKEAPESISSRFVGKRIPPEYSKQGLASPVLYKKNSHW